MSISFEGLNSACVSVFGDTVSYTPASTGVPVSIVAIKQDPSTLLGENPGGYIALWVDLFDWVGAVPVKGDTITIGADTWTLFELREDGASGMNLIFARTLDA